MLSWLEVAPSVVATVSMDQSIGPPAVSEPEPVVAVSVLPVMVVAAVSDAEPFAATEPSVATPLTRTVCASTRPLSALTVTLPGSTPAPVLAICLNATFWLACRVCVPPLLAVFNVMLSWLEVAPSVVATVSMDQSIAPPAVSEPEPWVAVSVLPVMLVPAVSDAEPLAETEPSVTTPLTRTVCASTKPLSALTVTLPGSTPAPVLAICLNATFWLACRVCVPPLLAVFNVMLSWLEVTPSVVATVSMDQSIGPPAVSEPEPVVAVSVLPVMLVPAVSEAEPLAETEPSVTTPLTRTVCASTKPLSALTVTLPGSIPAPVAMSCLNATFWLACRVCVPPLLAVFNVMLSWLEVAPSVVATVSMDQSIAPPAVSEPEPLVAVSVLPVMLVPAVSDAEPLAETEPSVTTPLTRPVCASTKPLSALTVTLPGSTPAPVLAICLNVTFWLACRVWVPPLLAVFNVMLSWLEVTPSVVATVSMDQSIGPPAVSEPEPVVAVSVLPVMLVPAVSEAEPLAETEPSVTTPLTRTVCASTKPLSALTVTLPGSTPAPVLVICLNVTFWLACSVCVPPLVAVFNVMLSWLEVAPSVVAVLSVDQSIGPPAVSEPEPLVAVNVLPVIAVPAVSDAEPLAETEPSVTTPLTGTVCASTKPLSALTVTLPGSTPAPVLAICLNVTF